MKRLASLVALIAMTACVSSLGGPDASEFQMARSYSSPPVALECSRFESLRCIPVASEAAAFQCRYIEWADHGPQVVKTAIVRRESDEWRWVSGDTPNCAAIALE